jgi:hypothetical protein
MFAFFHIKVDTFAAVDPRLDHFVQDESVGSSWTKVSNDTVGVGAA